MRHAPDEAEDRSGLLARAPTRYRPQRLAEVQGHERVREILRVLVAGAGSRGSILPHLLFSGPPGLGKTTLALVMAREVGVEAIHVQGDGLPVASLRELLQHLTPGQVLLIDEIHQLRGPAVELLYGPLEDGAAVIAGERVPVAPFTCFAATTHVGALPAPLRHRFVHHLRLDFVGMDDLALVAWQAAAASHLQLERDACVEIARRAKGAPRRAVQLVEWVADYASSRGGRGSTVALSAEEVDLALLYLGIGREGFDPGDRRYLAALVDQFAGGPVGYRALAAVLGEEPDTVALEIEPWLVREGYVIRSPRGRMLGPGPGQLRLQAG